MFFDHITRFGLALGFVISSAYSASAAGKHHSHKGYFKPGAAVALTYDYDGITRPGELENLTLKIAHQYSAGYVSARLLETADLQIISHGIIENEKIQDESTLEIPIQLSGNHPGEYFISLEIIYEALSGKRDLRVLSLPVQIGHLNASKNETESSDTSKASPDKGFVILTAQEIIK